MPLNKAINDLYQLEITLFCTFIFLLWCLEPLAPRASHFDPEYHNEDNLLHFEVHVIHMFAYASVVFTRQIAEFFRPERLICFVFFYLQCLPLFGTQLTQLITLYISVNKVSVNVCMTSYLDLPYVPEPSS